MRYSVSAVPNAEWVDQIKASYVPLAVTPTLYIGESEGCVCGVVFFFLKALGCPLAFVIAITQHARRLETKVPEWSEAPADAPPGATRLNIWRSSLEAFDPCCQ